jgi:hypothetical protein
MYTDHEEEDVLGEREGTGAARGGIGNSVRSSRALMAIFVLATAHVVRPGGVLTIARAVRHSFMSPSVPDKPPILSTVGSFQSRYHLVTMDLRDVATPRGEPVVTPGIDALDNIFPCINVDDLERP